MRQLGDEAILLEVEGGSEASLALARTLRAREVIPAATTVGVVGPYEILPTPPAARERRHHLVPVALDGADVESVGLLPEELGQLIEGCELRVAYLGFMPGFAYLEGLPPPLASLGRLPSPRPRVPPGSLAVAGGYAGIYPSASPGGWHLLGHTDLLLFEQDKAPYALFQPGDLVRFRLVDELASPAAPTRAPLTGNALEVVEPGPLLLVEDLGRKNAGALGVPRAGAFNSCWARILNLAVGNLESDALLECAGPVRLRARRDLLVAAGGAELFVAGTNRPPGTVTSVAAGQEIRTAAPRSGRSYLAVAGGIGGPESFESRSCDAVSGLSPGPLRGGDALPLAKRSGRPRLRFELPEPSQAKLRVIKGPDAGPLEAILADWRLEGSSDRTGLRLGGRPPIEGGGSVASHAVVPGAIQLPPGGSPIILGPDCGPIGGYPVLATVITADMWRLSTLLPGAGLSFAPVSVEEAERARRELSRLVEGSVAGWFPTAVA